MTLLERTQDAYYGIKDYFVGSQSEKPKVEAWHEANFKPLFVVSYDGEKNPGEIGDVIKYQPNYTRLRNRSWQFFLSSDIAQTIFRKYSFWIIGAGLKLQSEPIMNFLEEENVKINQNEFTRSVEARWKLYSKSKRSSFDGRSNLHKQALEAHKNAIVGGDVLIITRIEENNNITVQVVDGDNVRTPMLGGQLLEEDKGKKVVHGIVFNERGEHEAYYVIKALGKFERVKAKDSNGQLRAWLIIGLAYRPDNIRGIPLLSAVMETVAKLDRYKEAAVGSAEERQKVVGSIEHEEGSTGENPLSRNLAASRVLDKNLSNNIDQNGLSASDGQANLMAKTTNKQILNMPKGSKLKFHGSEMELGYKEFMMTNATIICATAQIPVEVAFSKYDSNFSASRAALKDWEHVIKVNRVDWSQDFYEPIYSLWLNIQVMTGKITNQPLLNSLLTNNTDVEEAIKNSRWIGQNVPHIDPVKEVQAERLKLGPLGANIPLSTPSQSTEFLGTGEYNENATRFNEEIELIEKPSLKQDSFSVKEDEEDEDESDSEKEK